ncbi:MAG: ATP-binding protein [bacterium]|nr:ATP-binding protein [bacterium]MDT8365617.1 ATP-binding protein [bacterium]
MLPASGSHRPRATLELPLFLKILMIFRVSTVTVLLSVTVLIQLKGSQVLFFAPLFTIYLIIIAVYLLTIFFATIFNQVRNLPLFAVYQVGTDLFLYTLIVFFTGGHSSPFPFLYLFAILWAALSLRGGGYWTASFSAILYGGIVDLQYYRILMPPYSRELTDILLVNPWDIIGRIFLHIVAFYAVAFLGHQIGYRYRSAREELSEKTVDLEKLQSLSDVVFESMTSGIVVLDEKGIIRSMNSASARMLGLEWPSAKGLTTSQIFHGIPMETLLEKAPYSGLNRWEGSFTEEGGQDRILGLSISPLQEPELGYVVIFTDLTELRKMEDKLQITEKLSAVGRMAASIAHEIRNPLASMSGSIQMLKKDLDLDGEDLKLMNIILKETERLNVLLGDFLAYARPPAPHFEDVDLREIIEDAVRLLRNTALESELNLLTMLPEERAILSVDMSQIHQIIMNLVKNSAEAIGGKGDIVISLTRSGNNPEGDSILAVSDKGPGIPKEILPRIFEPFITSKVSGTGLGLAIVYQLVQIHKGTVEIHSEEGQGTTVSVRLAPWRVR